MIAANTKQDARWDNAVKREACGYSGGVEVIAGDDPVTLFFLDY